MTVELPDGRVIAVLNSPMAGGGWVALHEDITEQRRAEQELARTKNFLDTVIENVPATIIVKDARDFRYILINQRGRGVLRPSGRTRSSARRRTTSCPRRRPIRSRRATTSCSRVDSQDFYHEPPLHKREGGMQLVSTRRRVIRGPDGEPRYLMSVVEDHDRAEAGGSAHPAHGAPRRPDRPSQPHDADGEDQRGAGAAAAARGAASAIFLLDLDQFKSVNDSLGHPMGDVLLKTVAQRLIACARETDIVARLGGDEFAILQAVERRSARSRRRPREQICSRPSRRPTISTASRSSSAPASASRSRRTTAAMPTSS